jgi:nitrous oxidase accessory protein
LIALLAVTAVTIVVGPSGAVPTITAALARARPGDTVMVSAGEYREPPLTVATPGLTILGEGRPVLRGGAFTTLTVTADRVTLRGLVFEGVEPTAVEDRAAILLAGTSECVVADNEIRRAFFGIYAREARGCRITGNRLRGGGGGGPMTGNGIHLWRSRGMEVSGNTVEGHRDGVYLEFSPAAVLRDNLVTRNQRYGLHFMRSDSCRYERNRFIANGAGAAVMYSAGVEMLDNRFERNWGPAAYGLLLKEISDGVVRGNTFAGNTVALYLEDSNRNLVESNRFTGNGWAVKVLANATANRFLGNTFEGNTFDVATNSRSASSEFRGNWWDRYRGYDLDRDGVGDVPFRPVRLFSLVVEQSEPSLILLRSPFVDLLDDAERLLPVLTPETLVDSRPLMHRPR